MPCELDVDEEVAVDILACDSGTRKQVGDFLLQLQEFPLPPGRHQSMSLGAYYFQLPCGYFISWELIGAPRALLQLTFQKQANGILVRVIGFARKGPPERL